MRRVPIRVLAETRLEIVQFKTVTLPVPGMSESTAGWRGRVTDENAVLVTAILVALPSTYAVSEQFGGAISVVFLLSLAVAIVPPIVYSSHWPRRYGVGKAVAWGLCGAAVVLAVMTAILYALEPLIAVDGGIVVAFAVVLVLQRYGPRVLIDS